MELFQSWGSSEVTARKWLPGLVFCAVDSRFQRVVPFLYLALSLRT